MDDIIVIGNAAAEREFLQKELTKEFEIKKLGRLKYLLVIEWLIPQKRSLFSKENMFRICLKKQKIFIAKQQALLLMQITRLDK